MFGDGGTMFFSRVSFILIPVIKRIFFVKTIHIIISVGFSQYRSGGYREVFSVSFYHGSMRNVRIFIETVSVDQQMLRTDRELIDSPVHRQKGGAENVYLVYLFGRHHSYRPCQRFFLYHFTKCVALLLGQLLRIIQQLILEISRKNDGGSIH